MKTALDVHTHTVASGHAFSTLQEMVQAAADKGLQLLGITEHAPSLPGTCAPIYFRNLHVVPRRMYGRGTAARCGAEHTGLSRHHRPGGKPTSSGWTSASPACIPSATRPEPSTRTPTRAGRHPQPVCPHHQPSGRRGRHRSISNRLCLPPKSTARCWKSTTVRSTRCGNKRDARANNLTILRLCKQYNVPVILGSDAHISFDIARYDFLYPLLQETDFPEQLILNDKVEAFKALLRKA